jgi:hypothetical protein
MIQVDVSLNGKKQTKLMKINFLPFFMVLAISSCTQNAGKSGSLANKNNITDDIVDTLCFERYSGMKNQDTASISIVIHGNGIRGIYSNFPYEKDSRKGIIIGSKTGETITGMWTYTQEGMTDSIRVEFKLKEDALFQKQTSFDLQSGRETIADTASFRLKYVMINCHNADSRMRSANLNF